MKTITLLASLFSFSALACPQLAGNYTKCSSGNMELSIMQREALGSQIYYISTFDRDSQERTVETYKADGKTYEQEMVDTDTGATVTYVSTTTCETDALLISTGLSYQNENEFLHIRLTKKNKKLIQKITGSNLGQTVNETIICE